MCLKEKDLNNFLKGISCDMVILQSENNSFLPNFFITHTAIKIHENKVQNKEKIRKKM